MPRSPLLPSAFCPLPSFHSSPFTLHSSKPRPRTNRARVRLVSARGAVLAAEVDDLQVAASPLLGGDVLREVARVPFDVLRSGQLPAAGQAVDVGVDREGRLAEGLGHDDARRLVAD